MTYDEICKEIDKLGFYILYQKKYKNTLILLIKFRKNDIRYFYFDDFNSVKITSKETWNRTSEHWCDLSDYDFATWYYIEKVFENEDMIKYLKGN